MTEIRCDEHDASGYTAGTPFTWQVTPPQRHRASVIMLGFHNGAQ